MQQRQLLRCALILAYFFSNLSLTKFLLDLTLDMTTNIFFSDLSIGDSVTNQFANDSGITFITPAGKVISDPKSPFGNALEAPRDGGPLEFPNWTIKGSFATQTHSRIGFTVNEWVTLTVKDKLGKVIGTTPLRPPKFTGDGSYFYGEFATGKANIASFEIGRQSDHAFFIAAIQFDTAGVHHKPDFRFMFGDADIPTQAGKHGFIEFTMARLYGSSGPIKLSISSNPAGLFSASPTPAPFSGGDGAKEKVTLVAGSNKIQVDNMVIITGTPSIATAGTTSRVMNYAYPGSLG